MRTNMAKAREKRGLSQVALAKLVGSAQSTIARVESGENMPGADLAVNLAKELGITVDELLVQESPEALDAPVQS